MFHLNNLLNLGYGCLTHSSCYHCDPDCTFEIVNSTCNLEVIVLSISIRQFLATENPLKMMKNVFYFI